MQLTAYRCLECGHYTISRRDGIRCSSCGGMVIPDGHATIEPTKTNGSTINISFKDTKIFQRMLDVFRALMDDKHTPGWIKSKIQSLVLNELEKE